MENWEFGAPAAHDWVVTHALQLGAVERKTPKADWAIDRAEASKESYAKERCEERGILFVPLAIDTFGGLGATAHEAVRKASSQARMCRGQDQELTRGRLVERVQVSLFRGIARQLLRRLAYDEEVPERPI